MKLNCWEYKNCGRQPGGHNEQKLGVCSTILTTQLDGSNGGVNAGRSCWVIAGTQSGKKVECVFAKQISNCMNCDFFQYVREQEAAMGSYIGTKQLFERFKPEKVLESVGGLALSPRFRLSF
jgi:hypothetical protein